MTSLETQVSAFRHKIANRPGWELVDIYVDEGLSGTNAKKRKAFQRMIADCEAGSHLCIHSLNHRIRAKIPKTGEVLYSAHRWS